MHRNWLNNGRPGIRRDQPVMQHPHQIEQRKRYLGICPYCQKDGHWTEEEFERCRRNTNEGEVQLELF